MNEPYIKFDKLIAGGFAHVKYFILGLSHTCDHEFGDIYSFSLATAVCDFHIYKDVWEPTFGKVIS